VPDGYIKGKPDVAFWMEQVRAGVEFRKKYAVEARWNTWRSYYRGQWKSGIMPVNLFFSMLRTVVPRVYFRNPSISVTPEMPGMEAAVFARILERVDNKLLRQMGAKKELKRVVQDGYLFGTGSLKLGFGSVYQPTPSEGVTGEPVTAKGERFEYRDKVYQNMPWAARLHTGKFIVPDGLCVYEDARWVAHWDKRPTRDIKDDPRFRNTKDIGPSVLPTAMGGIQGRIPMTDIIEIRDKKMSKVMVLAPFADRDARVLYVEDDEFLDRGSFNYYPVVFNEDDEVFWGVPDSVILEPYQLEINEIRTQMMKHRRLSLVKILHKKGAISVEELDKMLSEDVAASVEIDGDPRDDVNSMQTAGIPPDLIAAARELKEDFREAVGFSRNQFGEYKPGSSDTTATEAMIVRMASEIRVDERRDTVADALVDMVNGQHQIVFSHWSAEQAVEVVGPGGAPIWLAFTGGMLGKGQYLTKADPDTSVPETRQVREQRSEKIYELLKTNPMVDPLKLTQYLLHEHHGVRFDDMMRALPVPEGGVPSNGEAITADEFGGMLQSSLGQAQRAPRPQGGEGGGDRRMPAEGGESQRAGGNGASV